MQDVHVLNTKCDFPQIGAPLGSPTCIWVPTHALCLYIWLLAKATHSVCHNMAKRGDTASNMLAKQQYKGVNAG